MSSESDFDLIERSLNRSVEAIKGIDASRLLKIAGIVTDCCRRGGTVLLCGNGGSAAQAQHLAAELVCKFRKDRAPFRALALTTDTSILTAQANDVSFDTVFERQVEAHGRKGDVLIALSTSGNSPNIVAALRAARRKGIHTIALTGKDRRCKVAGIADEVLFAESSDTPRIQEAHITAGHIVCDLVEMKLSAK